MDLRDQIAAWIDAYYEAYPSLQRACLRVDFEDAGVPPAMQVGEADAGGEATWRLLPSPVSDEDLAALERDLGVTLPATQRAYLQARAHLFQQVYDSVHGEAIGLPEMPVDRPLSDLRADVKAWAPLLGAGYLPVATFGDGYGPICADLGASGEPPVVWFEHEELFDLGFERCDDRAIVAPLARPLFDSLLDLYEAAFRVG